MSYRPGASPLHAARAAAALVWFAAIGLAVVLASSPLLLGALTVAIMLAYACAGLPGRLAGALRIAALLALTICVINALVSPEGETVIWRFGTLPVLGVTNVTLEATVYGAVLGLRAAALVLLAGLYSAAVDPDEVLRLFRRHSFRSALTATIATRMVPVLVRDSHRLADAQRCRPGPPPGRMQLLRATTSGVLDRALDVAAALEVRGYGAARRAPRRRASRRPWSRHDLAFAGCGCVVAALAAGTWVAGFDPFTAFPVLRAPIGTSELVVTVAMVAAVLAPFADRRGIEP